LIGFIMGYFTSNLMMFRNIAGFYRSPTFTTIPHKRRAEQRKDIIYYSPGNDELWQDSYKEIPEGNGLIKGQIYIDVKPATGLELSLILASGQKTQEATVDKNGFYEIHLPKGKYFLNGLLIHNKSDLLNDKYLINRIALEEGIPLLLDDSKTKNIQKEYSELEKKYGAKKAAEEILKNHMASSGFKDRFGFEVTDKPFALPVFHYRDPVKILSPVENSTVNSADLKFIWAPVANAAYYKLRISRIDKNGTTTSYSPVITHDNISTNQIGYNELLKSLPKPGANNDCDTRETLEPKKIYGLKIIAYNKNNQVITASSLDSTELVLFSIKNGS
jgi:hypothetical protein